MSSLPKPTECKNHTPKFIDEITLSTSSSSHSYDLNAIHASYLQQKETILTQDKEGILISGFNLIEDRLYQSVYGLESESTDIIYQKHHLLNDPLFESILGYSFEYQSLTMTIRDENGEIQVIVIRHATDKDGKSVKWKTYGAKRYIPYKIHPDEDFVFIFSGMAELLLMELFEFSYIGLQSDSMCKHLPEHLKEETREKVIVILQDNDESFKSIVPALESFFSTAYQVMTIDFEKLLNRDLVKGYDFRDFCNEVGDVAIVQEKLIKEIQDGFRS
ncbi:MAG: hypothetical protein U9R50_00120 [Campylobacterota bacterium]|nr:hypothetical protein [Campylobacterota bacterium]